jgi:hypothetical protein
MKTVTFAMSNRRTAVLMPTMLPSGLVACVCLIALLGMSSQAQATDYRISGTCGNYSTMGHVHVEHARGTGTVSIDESECSGLTGCCCQDDCENAVGECGSVDGGQECYPQDSGPDCMNHCTECCHHLVYDNCEHQSCCTVDGDPEICCVRGAFACDTKIIKATIRKGCSCLVEGEIVAVLCDENEVGNECPGPGQRLGTTLTVGVDLSVADLLDMHNGLLSTYIEFQGGGIAVGSITNDGPKENPLFPVAALTLWGMITLAGLLATGGIVLMRQRRPRLA